jgi:thioredoxin reductase (NADPH)
MSAAIYAGRAKLKTLVIDRDEVGGQIKITSEVDNYPGILQTSGKELSTAMRTQAQRFGAEFLQTVVERVDFSQDIKEVHTTGGTHRALAVIVATGAVPRKLCFTGEDEYQGRGIGYCATCDGEFFTGMDVFVVGGGFAAAEEALFLTRYARKVTIIVRGAQFSCSKTIVDKVVAHPSIDVHFNAELREVGGDALPRYAQFADKSTGETWRYDVPTPTETFGVFVFAGYTPQSAEYAQELEVNEQGYILTDAGMRTKVDGIYAAGDIRIKELRQLVTAVADGAIAATNAEKYLADKRVALGLPEVSGADNESPAAAVGGGAAASARAAASTATAGTSASTAAQSLAESCSADSPLATGATAGAPTATSLSAQAKQPIGAFFDDALREQLAPILERLEREIGLLAVFDGNEDLDREIRAFLSEFSTLTSKVKVAYLQKGADPAREAVINATLYPTFAVLDAQGDYAGVQFHGVPAGHEINSFILALYNAAGPGQTVEEATLERIRAIDEKVNIKVGVSLSCTLCPDVVAATQLIALNNPLIEAEMIDVAHFPDFKARYTIMSVPALVINDKDLHFGKKTLDELVSLVSAK